MAPCAARLKLRYCEDLTGDGQHVEQKHISGFVRTGEFQDGQIYQKERRPEEWTPQFAYHGFRYVEAEGLPEELPDRASWALRCTRLSSAPDILNVRTIR